MTRKAVKRESEVKCELLEAQQSAIAEGFRQLTQIRNTAVTHPKAFARVDRARQNLNLALDLLSGEIIAIRSKAKAMRLRFAEQAREDRDE